MGVVYKLKQEVIDFILEQKKNYPQISCRQLTAVSQEKFQVNISKSSINAIIKSANLSSPIGRRNITGDKSKRYKIPKKKKEDLFQNPVSEPLPLESPEIKPESSAEKVREPGIEPRTEPEPIAPHEEIPSPVEPRLQQEPIEPAIEQEREETPSLLPDPLANASSLEQPLPKVEPGPQPEIDPQPETKPELALTPQGYVDDKIWTPSSDLFQKKHQASPGQPQEILDHMGYFFLKAAEWELSNSSILGNLLSKHINFYSPSDVNSLSEVLLYLKAFGIKTLSDIEGYEKKGLYLLNNLSQPVNAQVLSKMVGAVQNLASLAAAAVNEYSQLFSEVSYIKLSLADKSEIAVDAQLKSLWLENNLSAIFPKPLNKALTLMSNQFISNTRPLFIFNIPGYKTFAKQFYDFLCAFENIPEKAITKISIHDARKDEIAKFTAIPSKKRYFAVGLWPWQEECKKFIEDDIKIIKQFRHELLEKEIYFSELKTNLTPGAIGQSLRVRVGLLRESGLSWPYMGILTNIAEDAMSMEDILTEFLNQFSQAQEGYQDFVARQEKASYGAIVTAPAYAQVPLIAGPVSQGGTFLTGHIAYYNLVKDSKDVQTVVDFFLSALNNYCQRQFFPVPYETLAFQTLQERIYSLSGTIQRGERIITVTLLIPYGYAFTKDLEYAIRRLNESSIFIYNGQRLLLRLEKNKSASPDASRSF